ncbi:unnamed protein product [Bursaphelenchus xylophilus]|uniref:(pine wood nematode) hypothetical protein n=1 Tax=Bursaphelenchus xylophilus TaxID=6326 RepID=A0A7I8X038_BURXY|nr:unnamed protein product [Bursaphelenchus xylophilus]CAG9102473.1 unnamed protein product [Bursaphelenchus xylophilus]
MGFLFIQSELKATEGRIHGWPFSRVTRMSSAVSIKHPTVFGQSNRLKELLKQYEDKDQNVSVLSTRYGSSKMRQNGEVSWSNLKRMECGIDALTRNSLKTELSTISDTEGHILETT